MQCIASIESTANTANTARIASIANISIHAIERNFIVINFPMHICAQVLNIIPVSVRN